MHPSIHSYIHTYAFVHTYTYANTHTHTHTPTYIYIMPSFRTISHCSFSTNNIYLPRHRVRCRHTLPPSQSIWMCFEFASHLRPVPFHLPPHQLSISLTTYTTTNAKLFSINITATCMYYKVTFNTLLITWRSLTPTLKPHLLARVPPGSGWQSNVSSFEGYNQRCAT
jgi:hypothetical protein